MASEAVISPDVTIQQPATLEIGVVCANLDGHWNILDVLPNIDEAKIFSNDEQAAVVGVYMDILATAIKYLAVKYLVKEQPQSPSGKSS